MRVSFFGIGPAGNTLDDSVQVCQWLVEAGVDAIHVSTGAFFPHPRNPAGSDLARRRARQDLRHDDLERRPDVPQLLLFRTAPGICAACSGSRRVPAPEKIEGLNLPDARAIKAAVNVPVICTGGFQTASVIATAIERRRLRRGQRRAAADRQQRPGRDVRGADRTAPSGRAPTATAAS